MTRQEATAALKRAAARATLNDHTGATDKQCYFLAKLVSDNETTLPPWVEDENGLTKQGASDRIKVYLGEEEEEAAPPPTTAPTEEASGEVSF